MSDSDDEDGGGDALAPLGLPGYPTPLGAANPPSTSTTSRRSSVTAGAGGDGNAAAIAAVASSIGAASTSTRRDSRRGSSSLVGAGGASAAQLVLLQQAHNAKVEREREEAEEKEREREEAEETEREEKEQDPANAPANANANEKQAILVQQLAMQAKFEQDRRDQQLDPHLIAAKKQTILVQQKQLMKGGSEQLMQMQQDFERQKARQDALAAEHDIEKEEREEKQREEEEELRRQLEIEASKPEWMKMMSPSKADAGTGTGAEQQEDSSVQSTGLDSRGRRKKHRVTGANLVERRGSQWERAITRKNAAKFVQDFERVYEPSRLKLTILAARKIPAGAGGAGGSGGAGSTFDALFGPKPDPFVIVRLDGSQVARTKIVRGTGMPEWGQELILELPLDREYTDCVLEIMVYDANDGVGELPREDAGVTSSRRPKSSIEMVKTILGTYERDGVATYVGSIKFIGEAQLAWIGANDVEDSQWHPLKNGRDKSVGEIKFKSVLLPGTYVDVPRKRKKKQEGGEEGNEEGSVQTLLTETFLSEDGQGLPVKGGGAPEEDIPDDDDDDASSNDSDSTNAAADDDDAEDDQDDQDEDDTIEITVIAAKNLSKTDSLGLSDPRPYAVVIFNGVEIGRTNSDGGGLYPRWQQQSFTVTVPAGAGVYFEGKEYNLVIELYDGPSSSLSSSSTSSHAFLGCCSIEREELESLLGLKATPEATAALQCKTLPCPSYRFPYAEQIERGSPQWFSLGPSKTRGPKENRYAKGGLQIAGAYISGVLRPFSRVPVPALVTAPAPMTRLSIHVEAAAGLAKIGGAGGGKNRMSLTGLLSSSKKKKSSTGDDDNALPETTSYCVVRWNGNIVGSSHAVRQSYDPYFHTHFLVPVNAQWDLRHCWLEVELYGETSLSGRFSGTRGPFLGAALIRGPELLDLLSARVTEEGDWKLTSFPLKPTEHIAKDEQTLVRGSVTLRGFVDSCAWDAVESVNGNGNGRERPSSTVVEESDAAVRLRPHLVVGVAEATSLPQTDRFGTANAYVQTYWCGRLRGITPVQPNQLNPVWEKDNESLLAVPPDVQLVDCVLEFKVLDRGRMGKISFLGQKRLTGEALEALAQLRGDLFWLDLEPSPYLNEKTNALVSDKASLRVRCQYFDHTALLPDAPPCAPPPNSRTAYQPAKVSVKVLGLSEIAPLQGLKSMAAITSRSMPFLQFLWNGREVGCTTALSISALILDDADAATRVHEWHNEIISFALPHGSTGTSTTRIEHCSLEIVAWDSGLLNEKGLDTFLGRRLLTGPELARLVFHTTRYAPVLAGESPLEPAEPRWLALGRTWALPIEEQANVRPRVLLDIAFVLESFPPEAVVAARDGSGVGAQSDEELLLALAMGTGNSMETGGLPAGEEKGGEALIRPRSRQDDLDLTTLGTHSTEEFYTEEELAEQEAARREAYWAQLKAEQRIDIPPGALHYFTKHFEDKTGKFYYHDHVTGLSTYDRPPGELKLFKTEDQLDDMRALLEARAAENESSRLQRAKAMLRMKTEKEAAMTYHANQQRLALAREQKKVWNRVVDDGAANNGSVSIAWQNFGYIDPLIYSFTESMRMPLRALRLVGMGLSELPEDFGQRLPTLEVLSLSNNLLTSLPDSFILLTNLRELNVLRNRLTRLPERIGLLCSLERLEVANNALEKLPVTFGALNLMERVDLECNALSVLPENLDNMTSCRFLNVNHNRLQRLPRCLARMPSLTSVSATHNLISYIPTDLTSNIRLKFLRLSCNRIKVVPEKIGDLKRLHELALDWNLISVLPLTFYKLKKLRTCRLDGNESLGDPPPDVIVLGAPGIVEYFRKRFEDDITYRMRKIISAVQGLLHQVVARGLADPSLFEPDSKVEGSEDPWFALQLSYFWSDLVPAMRKVWAIDGHKAEHGALNSFTYDEKEVLWAFQNFNDAYGTVFRRQKAMFRRCSCVDKEGRRKPCVPPMVGFYCRRVATLFKARVVMFEVRKERLWLEQKRAGVAEAVKKSEREALQYLNSKAGKLWLETEAYRRAEVAFEALGGATADKWRKRAADRQKSSIIAQFDKKRRKVEAIRDQKAAEWNEELDRARSDLKGAREGYMKNSLEEQVVTLTHAIASMPENAVIKRLAAQCVRRCADVDDEWADADSTDSSDSDAEMVSSGDESPGAERRRARYKRRYLESQSPSKLRGRVNKEVEEYKIPLDPLEIVVAGLQAAWDVIWPHSQQSRRRQFKVNRRYKRWLRNLFDVVDIRIRKLFLTAGGSFDEMQKECKHELFRQYLQGNIDLARAKARKEYSVIDEVRQNMGGVGLEKVFRTWKKWALNKAQRLRRDARGEYKTAVKVFDAAMESVRIAQARVEMWKKHADIYTDAPFWIHELTGQITTDKPGLQHFLPPSFEMPPPPKDLPEGISYDTSESEDENAWRTERKSSSKKAVGAGEDAEALSSSSGEEEDEDEEGQSGDDDDGEEEDDEDDDEEDDEEDGDDNKDDMSAITGASRGAGSTTRLPAIVPASNVPAETGDSFLDKRRRVSDVISPRDWPAVRDDAKNVRDDATVATFRTAKTAKTQTSSYSYGPDSLRPTLGMPGRIGRAHFQDDPTPPAEVSDLELRVEIARQFLREKAARGQDGGGGGGGGRGRRGGVALPAVIVPTGPSSIEEVRQEVELRAYNESKKADQKLRRLRAAISQARHDTYMSQANRLPRSFEQTSAILRAKEAMNVYYTKPHVNELFELAGADPETMMDIPGNDGIKLRTLIAYRALHVKQKLHKRAVNNKLTRPKKMNLIGDNIAPIWRENYVGSSDEEEDDDEALRAKEARKTARKTAKAAKAEKLLEAEENARNNRQEGAAGKKARVYVPEKNWANVGKPRDVVSLISAKESEH